MIFTSSEDIVLTLIATAIVICKDVIWISIRVVLENITAHLQNII
jgi:hypothetical protein